ncbi:Ribose 5-phosphate isomerase, type A [Artemisia annua]|uniref:ribose-5-phosphate isomerase n=1 Tax=Artemisia annua TaxID=35608 RepID=A0A2U1MQY0_ARTAN|nr:Ribose 5-phosphate isomerase, type A [Artemisia annua]
MGLYQQAANKLNEINGINGAEENDYTEDELLAALDLLEPPENFQDHQWQMYKNYLRKPIEKKLSSCGKKARLEHAHTRTIGATSFARSRHEWKVKNKRSPHDVESFHICYKTADDTYIEEATTEMMGKANEEILRKKKEIGGREGDVEHAVEAEIAMEVLNKLIGDEEPHCFGAGVTKSQVSKFSCDLRKMRGDVLTYENRFLLEKVETQLKKQLETQKKQLETQNKEIETHKKQLDIQNKKVESYVKQVETQGLQLKNMEESLNNVYGMLKVFQTAFPDLYNVASTAADANTCDKQGKANEEILRKKKEIGGPEGDVEHAVEAEIAMEVLNKLIGDEEPHCFGAGVTKSQVSKFSCDLRKMRGDVLTYENRFLLEKVETQLKKQLETQKKQLETQNKEIETHKKQLDIQNKKVESYIKQVETQGLQLKNMEESLNNVYGMLKVFQTAFPDLYNVASTAADAHTCDKQPSSSVSPVLDHYSPIMEHYSPAMDHYPGKLLASGQLTNIIGVPTSKRTQEQAAALGITLSILGDHPKLDLAIDGANEVDPDLNLVKGRGGALLREKMVEATSNKCVVVVDDSKLVTGLGGSGLAMPVQVVQFCWK